jgi:hypothetical protein
MPRRSEPTTVATLRSWVFLTLARAQVGERIAIRPLPLSWTVLCEYLGCESKDQK